MFTCTKYNLGSNSDFKCCIQEAKQTEISCVDAATYRRGKKQPIGLKVVMNLAINAGLLGKDPSCRPSPIKAKTEIRPSGGLKAPHRHTLRYIFTVLWVECVTPNHLHLIHQIKFYTTLFLRTRPGSEMKRLPGGFSFTFK